MGNRLHTQTIRMPLVAAGTGEEIHSVAVLPSSKGYVAKAWLVADETSAENASNFTALTLKIGSTTIATHSTETGEGGTLTKATPVELSLSGDRSVADGDVLSMLKTDSGTGVAFIGSVVLQIEERPIP